MIENGRQHETIPKSPWIPQVRGLGDRQDRLLIPCRRCPIPISRRLSHHPLRSVSRDIASSSRNGGGGIGGDDLGNDKRTVRIVSSCSSWIHQRKDRRTDGSGKSSLWSRLYPCVAVEGGFVLPKADLVHVVVVVQNRRRSKAAGPASDDRRDRTNSEDKRRRR
jgi:hypothetical protein